MRSAPLLALALVSACAPSSNYRPAVDLSDADAARFETDLADCKRVAERDRYAPVLVAALQGAALGTALGAAFVGVAAGAAGNVGLAESYGAISGTVAGAGFGALQVEAPQDEPSFVDQCLRNNGYTLRQPP
jgi:hypothetical protein